MFKRITFFSIIFFKIVFFAFGQNDSLKRKSILISVTPNLTGIYRLIPGNALGVNSSFGVKIPLNKKNNYSISFGFWYAPLKYNYTIKLNNSIAGIRNTRSFYYLSLPFRYQRKTKIMDLNVELSPLLLLHQNFINNERKYNVNFSFDLSKSIKITKQCELAFGIGFLTSKNLFSIYNTSFKISNYRNEALLSNLFFLRIEYSFR